MDSQNPGASDILSSNFFGSDGDPVTHCMTTGVASGWQGMANSNGCLKRCNQFGALYAPEAVTAIINRATEFTRLSEPIENGPHGAVHIQLGGECGDFSSMASANDPSMSILT